MTGRVAVAALVATWLISGQVRGGPAAAPPEVSTAEPVLGGGPDPLADTAQFIESLQPGEARESEAVGDDGLRAGDCCYLGGYVNVFSIRNFFQGNVIRITEEETILNFSMELNFTSGAAVPITFAIYKRDPATAKYNQVAIRVVNHTGTGRKFYSSGTFNLAVAPEIGGNPAFYALGVGWGATDIQFARDSGTYPQLDCDRRTEGSWGLSIAPPPPTQITLGTLYTGGALSMQVCFLPPPGACCLPNHTCQMTADQSACSTLNGEFTAGGVQCEAGLCPLTRGACCILPETCAYVNEYACTSGLGGTSWNGGDDCSAPNPCAPPSGACCIYDGTCRNDVVEGDCMALYGTYMGDYTICDDPRIQCEGTGACCLPTSGCLDMTTADCGAQLPPGVFHGVGTHCQLLPDFPLNPCDQSLGACCSYDGGCDLTTEYACEAGTNGVTPGTWLGAGVSCSVANCQPMGACCEGFTNCTDTTSNGCTGGRTWRQGEPCAYGACSGQVGACCVLGECQIANDFECEQLGGVHYPAGTNGYRACDPGIAPSCSNGNLGACCVDGVCSLVTAAECAATNGFFSGAGVPCSDLVCVTGRCCLANEVCAELTALECQQLGGTPSTPGTTCAGQPNPCVTTGACCYSTRGGPACDRMEEATCTIVFGGEFQGLDTTCTPDGCAEGACCRGTGVCVEETVIACQQVDHGVYMGDASSCGLVDCQTNGACCIGGACQVVSMAACVATNGVWQGTGSACDAGRCNLGTCCPADGMACVDGQVPSQCLGGLHTPGAVCNVGSPDTCAVACCIGGTCANLLPAECAATNGAADPERQLCADDPDLCALGACCLPGPLCEELSSPMCAKLGGDYAGAQTQCLSGGGCAKGACCHWDGTCEEDIYELLCADVPCGQFNAGLTCAAANCDASCAAFDDQICTGRYDVDADVDLFDFAVFERCFGKSPPSLECRCIFDFNRDGDINLVDFATFLLLFTGPTESADAGACCQPDGTCQDGQTAAACAAVPCGQFHLGALCGRFACADLCGAAADRMCSGRFDLDADVDLIDYAGFQACFGPTPPAECRCIFDFDRSESITLSDYARLASTFTGPQ